MAVNPCPMSRVALAIGPRRRRRYALAQRPVSKSVTGRARNAPLMDHTCGNARVIAYLSAFLFIIVEMSENTFSIDGVAVNEWIARACLYNVCIQSSSALHFTYLITYAIGLTWDLAYFMEILWQYDEVVVTTWWFWPGSSPRQGTPQQLMIPIWTLLPTKM